MSFQLKGEVRDLMSGWWSVVAGGGEVWLALTLRPLHGHSGEQHSPLLGLAGATSHNIIQCSVQCSVCILYSVVQVTR